MSKPWTLARVQAELEGMRLKVTDPPSQNRYQVGFDTGFRYAATTALMYLNFLEQELSTEPPPPPVTLPPDWVIPE